MKADDAHRDNVFSTAAQEGNRVFARLSRYLDRVSKHSDIQSIHRFRTNSRRVEALVAELVPESANKRKLLKQLAKLRNKAGKLRDLDVQQAFLKELKMPDRQNHRAELIERLREEHELRVRKIGQSFDSGNLKKLRKRLRRAKAEVKFAGLDPLELALKRLPRPEGASLNEQQLHASRIAAKRARYLAELAGDTTEAKEFIEQLKRAQDAIGQWHDVLKLEERAEKLFGGVHDSALVSVLQNITGARFRRATSALFAALSRIEELRQKTPPAKASKSEGVAAQATAVA
jgi:CHAD domain-containing protein